MRTDPAEPGLLKGLVAHCRASIILTAVLSNLQNVFVIVWAIGCSLDFHCYRKSLQPASNRNFIT